MQLMVCNAMQKWLTVYMQQDELDAALLRAFDTFLAGPLEASPPTSPTGARISARTFAQCRRGSLALCSRIAISPAMAAEHVPTYD